MSLHARFLLCAVLVAACSDEGGPTIDAAVGSADASSCTAGFTATCPDAGIADARVADAQVTDAQVADAGDQDAGAACHALGFGATVVTLQQVGSLPTMTGGTIPLGAYDAVAFQTTGGLSGSYRGSWYFESSTTMQLFEQLALNNNPPPTPTPRTFSWTTTGPNLMRVQTCGPNSNSFDNGYTVRVVGPDTFLDVRSGGVMFTFKKRP